MGMGNAISQNKLTDKQEMFCQYYMGSFNGTQSAIKAGYNENSAAEMATENLTKPQIVARLSELSKDLVTRTKLDQEIVVEKLKTTANFRVTDMITIEDGKVFIKNNEDKYRNAGEVTISSPKVINKNALIFCTYSGPHFGINEALPVGKYIRQFFEHLGFDVKGEWYEAGEFHGWEAGSTRGRLGDIRGRPNAEDLALVELKTIQLVRSF